MAEGTEKKIRVTINMAAVLKLAAAITALAAAINGYVQIRKDQNNMLEVISDKVDAIVLKVAYLEGRVDGLTPKEAAKEAERRIQVLPAPIPADTHAAVAVPLPTSEDPSEIVKVDNKLYRQMPRSFDALQAVVEQKIVRLDHETDPMMAAPPEVSP